MENKPYTVKDLERDNKRRTGLTEDERRFEDREIARRSIEAGFNIVLRICLEKVAKGEMTKDKAKEVILEEVNKLF